MNAVTEAEVDALMNVYREKYDFATDNIDAIRYQAREEIAMKKMMDARGLQSLLRIPSRISTAWSSCRASASQHLMAQGYGYGGEGDWKVAAMTAILKAMGENGNGASGVHGGLHLPPCQRSGIQPWRAHAGGLPVRRCRPSAHRDALLSASA